MITAAPPLRSGLASKRRRLGHRGVDHAAGGARRHSASCSSELAHLVSTTRVHESGRVKLHQLCGQRHGLNDLCPLPATHPHARLTVITEGTGSADPERLLAALGAAAGLREWLERTETRLVTHARQTGLSWAAIGEAWDGLSRQGAHNRYHRRPAPTPAPRQLPLRAAESRSEPRRRPHRPAEGKKGRPPATGAHSGAQPRPRRARRGRG